MRTSMINNRDWLRRSVGAAAVASCMLWSTALVTLADSPNTSTLAATCDNGQEVTLELAANQGNGAFPSGLRVTDSTSVFTIHQFTLTSLATGQIFTIKNDSGVAHGKDLVSCTRIGNQFVFTWTGFFTPAS